MRIARRLRRSFVSDVGFLPEQKGEGTEGDYFVYNADTDADLSRLCLLELEETKEIVRRMFQESLVDLLTRETFQRAASQREISIQLSDYMGEYEPLLVLNHQTKETGEWLNGIL